MPAADLPWRGCHDIPGARGALCSRIMSANRLDWTAHSRHLLVWRLVDLVGVDRDEKLFARMLAIRDTLSLPGAWLPMLHLSLKALGGLVLVALAFYELSRGNLWGWHWVALVPGLLFASALEHVIHRGPMHHRTRLSPYSFRSHMLVHHRVFAPGLMGIRKIPELFFVIFHWRFDVLVLAIVALAYAICTWLAANAVGDVLVITFAVYAVCLDWIHVIDHLPDVWIKRLGLDLRPIQWLRRYHALHHDPRQMNEANFNILIPLGDIVLRTYRYKDCLVAPPISAMTAAGGTSDT
jgi:hypothetical protein